jgi:hypothetical protein
VNVASFADMLLDVGVAAWAPLKGRAQRAADAVAISTAHRSTASVIRVGAVVEFERALCL